MADGSPPQQLVAGGLPLRAVAAPPVERPNASAVSAVGSDVAVVVVVETVLVPFLSPTFPAS